MAFILEAGSGKKEKKTEKTSIAVCYDMNVSSCCLHMNQWVHSVHRELGSTQVARGESHSPVTSEGQIRQQLHLAQAAG